MNAQRKRPKEIKTSIYLPPDLFWKLKEITVAKRLPTDNEAMEQAVREWVERESLRAKPSHKAKPA